MKKQNLKRFSKIKKQKRKNRKIALKIISNIIPSLICYISWVFVVKRNQTILFCCILYQNSNTQDYIVWCWKLTNLENYFNRFFVPIIVFNEEENQKTIFGKPTYDKIRLYNNNLKDKKLYRKQYAYASVVHEWQAIIPLIKWTM